MSAQIKLLQLRPKPVVYVFEKPVSMACGFPKLIDFVETAFNKEEIQSGNLYLFVNKKTKYCKLLFWSKGGFCILAKRLEGGKFQFNLSERTLTIEELSKKLVPLIRNQHGKLDTKGNKAQGSPHSQS